MTELYDPEFIFLSQEDVIASGGLDMPATLDDVELAYKLFSSGQVNQPHKSVMHHDHPETGEDRYYLTNAMPVYVGGEIRRAGIKWAAESMDNAKRGDMPMGIDIIILHDLEHAIPHAIMEGGLITAMRTSAVGGVGAKYLANPDSKVAGLIGSGIVGRTMIMALTSAMPLLEEVRLYDLDEDKSRQFKDADIITSQTTARNNIVFNEWIPNGSYYAHMAANEAEDAAFLATDLLVVDNWRTLRGWDFFPPTQLVNQGKLKEGEIVDIGDIILGNHDGRTNPEQNIIFANLGMGCLDIAIAERIYRNAKAKGLGQKLRLWDTPKWL
jgi:ornithine cyclodeaminase